MFVVVSQLTDYQTRRTLDGIGDPTDSACAVMGWKLNGNVRKFSQRHPRLHEFFFDTERKRMSVIHEYEGERWVFVKAQRADLFQSLRSGMKTEKSLIFKKMI